MKNFFITLVVWCGIFFVGLLVTSFFNGIKSDAYHIGYSDGWIDSQEQSYNEGYEQGRSDMLNEIRQEPVDFGFLPIPE
ncbi:MAG: hypothetical protein SOR83_00990 [Butyricicoccus pullicaecorum]|nr:hypothetical protein [Butyricicoccus pullicaecorum]